MKVKKLERLKFASLLLIVGFYMFAGANHFISPEFYYPLIPDYLPWTKAINVISGLAEILLALGLLFKPTRKLSAMLIIAMLIAFLPAHVYFIELGGCVHEGLCVPAWVAWVRLLVIHPILIAWAWWHRK
ncbi:DoxX family protein [Roseivirga misakiensis]|uniref:DoxX family protein n=1 Tax=Roseivirga misakiensis TaxID=1563681 RepID=A0A1E5SZV5_9BACT|nr:hypothetical protein [Roseivirga misakiensis]OEK04639.1 hypothetical protein BFP71_14380 [Roseivirga misakiensis]